MPGNRAPEEERREQILRAAYGVAVRDRLQGLTVRCVAVEAGLSSGLVFFHFGTKDGLLVALLDWLLEQSIFLDVEGEVKKKGSPLEKLTALLGQETSNSPRDREELELLFDYWAIGTRLPEVREKIRCALRRYREAFGRAVQEIFEQETDRFAFPGVTATELAELTASIIEGCAMRAVLDPDQANDERVVGAVQALLAQVVAESGGVRT